MKPVQNETGFGGRGVPRRGQLVRWGQLRLVVTLESSDTELHQLQGSDHVEMAFPLRFYEAVYMDPP
jgi:hypothetical protein